MTTLVTTISLIIALGISAAGDLTSGKYAEQTEVCGGPEGSTIPPPQH